MTLLFQLYLHANLVKGPLSNREITGLQFFPALSLWNNSKNDKVHLFVALLMVNVSL